MDLLVAIGSLVNTYINHRNCNRNTQNQGNTDLYKRASQLASLPASSLTSLKAFMMKLNSSLLCAFTLAMPMAFAALDPGPEFVRLNKSDSVQTL